MRRFTALIVAALAGLPAFALGPAMGVSRALADTIPSFEAGGTANVTGGQGTMSDNFGPFSSLPATAAAISTSNNDPTMDYQNTSMATGSVTVTGGLDPTITAKAAGNGGSLYYGSCEPCSAQAIASVSGYLTYYFEISGPGTEPITVDISGANSETTGVGDSPEATVTVEDYTTSRSVKSQGLASYLDPLQLTPGDV
jgi:hypothetical protein